MCFVRHTAYLVRKPRTAFVGNGLNRCDRVNKFGMLSSEGSLGSRGFCRFDGFNRSTGSAGGNL